MISFCKQLQVNNSISRQWLSQWQKVTSSKFETSASLAHGARLNLIYAAKPGRLPHPKKSGHYQICQDFPLFSITSCLPKDHGFIPSLLCKKNYMKIWMWHRQHYFEMSEFRLERQKPRHLKICKNSIYYISQNIYMYCHGTPASFIPVVKVTLSRPSFPPLPGGDPCFNI